MIREALSARLLGGAHAPDRALRPRSRADRERARGVRPSVPLPLDMFDHERTEREVSSARKLEGIYHKGQARAWQGKDTLASLVAQHGGIRLTADRRDALRTLFSVILWGELAAWRISSDLAFQLEPLEAKMAATSQAHDEARHFYVMHDYLELLGGRPAELGPRTRAVFEGTLRADTLAKKLIGMQLMIEPMALTIFRIVREWREEPILADLLAFYERDEARHVALGVLHLPKLLTAHTLPEALDLWSWQFREYWKQLAMMREIEPALQLLGIDPKLVIAIGRDKQVRAHQMLIEEIGFTPPVFEALLRFFDGKAEWEFPTTTDRRHWGPRMRGALTAMFRGLDDVPTELTDVPA